VVGGRLRNGWKGYVRAASGRPQGCERAARLCIDEARAVTDSSSCKHKEIISSNHVDSCVAARAVCLSTVHEYSDINAAMWAYVSSI
jgi:hypothetical protein